MYHPRRYLRRMTLFLGCITLIVIPFGHSFASFFLANPILNGVILGLLLIGIIAQFRNVFGLAPEYKLIEAIKRQHIDLPSDGHKLRLLGPLFSMLREERGQIRLSAQSYQTILDSVSARLDEDREISRYLTRILIFLGLLGTFWGLLETIQSVGNVINALPSGEVNAGLVFGDLKNQLKAPLSGMGIGFSSSLFGLSSSLILGFLDLQAGQAQNRFYSKLEDWLSGQTKLSGTQRFDGEGDSVPAYLSALVEKSADHMEHLTKLIAQEDHNRRNLDQRLLLLTEKLSLLSDQMHTEQSLLLKLGEGQMELRPVLKALGEQMYQGQFGFDDASKSHLRNMDLSLQHMLQENARSKEQFANDIKAEIRLIARMMSQLQDTRKTP